jgi:hypothetical protein
MEFSSGKTLRFFLSNCVLCQDADSFFIEEALWHVTARSKVLSYSEFPSKAPHGSAEVAGLGDGPHLGLGNHAPWIRG